MAAKGWTRRGAAAGVLAGLLALAGGAASGLDEVEGNGNGGPRPTACEAKLELITNHVRADGGPDDFFLIVLDASSASPFDFGPLTAESMQSLTVTVTPTASTALARGFVGATSFDPDRFADTGIDLGLVPPRVVLFTGDPDPLDPTASSTRAEACHVFEVIRTAQRAITLRHLGEVEFEQFVDDGDGGFNPETIDGLLPTAATVVSGLYGHEPDIPQGLSCSQLHAFALATSAPADNGANLFEVEICFDEIGDPETNVFVARPRAELPSFSGSGVPSTGIEGLEIEPGGFTSRMFVAHPRNPGQTTQDGELVLYDDDTVGDVDGDGDGDASFLACVDFTSAQVARFDGVTPTPVSNSQQPTVRIDGTASQLNGPTGPRALGVRSARATDGLGAGLFEVPAPVDLAGVQAPANTAASTFVCQAGEETDLFGDAGVAFIAGKPEVLAVVGPPLDGLEAIATITPLGDNRFAVSLTLTDASGDAILGFTPIDPISVDVTLAGITGTVEVTNFLGDPTTFTEDGNGGLTNTLDLVFRAGTADQQCALDQLIVTLETLEPFSITLEELATGAIATATFDPTTGALTIKGGGCALDPGAGLAGLLGLAPFALAIAAAATARRRAGRAARADGGAR